MKEANCGPDAISPRKAMAQGKSNPMLPQHSEMFKGKANPDRGMAHAPMADGDRAIGAPIARGKGMHPMQAAPKHG